VLELFSVVQSKYVVYIFISSPMGKCTPFMGFSHGGPFDHIGFFKGIEFNRLIMIILEVSATSGRSNF
jgi:hypothetical protein